MTASSLVMVPRIIMYSSICQAFGLDRELEAKARLKYDRRLEDQVRTKGGGVGRGDETWVGIRRK